MAFGGKRPISSICYKYDSMGINCWVKVILLAGKFNSKKPFGLYSCYIYKNHLTVLALPVNVNGYGSVNARLSINCFQLCYDSSDFRVVSVVINRCLLGLLLHFQQFADNFDASQGFDWCFHRDMVVFRRRYENLFRIFAPQFSRRPSQ